MNEIVMNFLLAGYKFMPEMHSKQLGFTYSACGPFAKKKEGIQNLKKQEIHDIELDNICFQHDMVYGDFKDFNRRAPSDKHCVIKYLILLKIRWISKKSCFNDLKVFW